MPDLNSLSREELIALIVAQQTMIADQQRQIAELREEIDQLRRGGKRQAAPFSKGQRVESPKAPGRKPGRGPFRRRAEPVQPALDDGGTVTRAHRRGLHGSRTPDRVDGPGLIDP